MTMFTADKIPHYKVAVTDTHDLIREGISSILRTNGLTQIDSFSNATSLLSHLDSGSDYDLHIIDTDFPDMNGSSLIKEIRRRNGNCKILVCTANTDVWTIRGLFPGNPDGIIHKKGNREELLKAIREVKNGNVYYSPELKDAIEIARNNSLHPTVRELEVLYRIVEGKTSREIALAMLVSENTVEAHRKSLFAKMGAVNAADLVIKALSRGYIRKFIYSL